VEYGRIVSGAWSITVRTRALWWLGAISAAQAVVYAVVVGAIAAPMAMMPQLASAISAADNGTADTIGGDRLQLLVTAAQWVGSHTVAISLVAGGVFSAWLILGVFDVAAQVGIVSQVDAVADRRPASAGAGLRDGFRYWWRTVALLALAALPGLIYLLAMALVMLFTISLPLYLGQPPKAGAALVSNLALTPLSGVVTLLAVPLGVLVQLAVRFAVVDDAEWRSSFGAAWRLAKANLAELAIVYVMIAAFTLCAVAVFAAIAAASAVVIGVLFLGVGLAATAGDPASAGRVALAGSVGFIGLLFLAFQAVMFIWQSAVWTLVWRDRTGRDIRSTAEHRVPHPAAASTTEGGL
jgi:hypothetical protein